MTRPSSCIRGSTLSHLEPLKALRVDIDKVVRGNGRRDRKVALKHGSIIGCGAL
jgi:hypothetical protein